MNQAERPFNTGATWAKETSTFAAIGGQLWGGDRFWINEYTRPGAAFQTDHALRTLIPLS